jgi:hypothetical protein
MTTSNIEPSTTDVHGAPAERAVTACSTLGENEDGSFLDRVIARIEAAGYVVERGRSRAANPALAYELAILTDCNGNNAGKSYNVALVPRNPTDPDSSVPVDSNNPEGARVDFAYRILPEEAVVFVGKTPPGVDYFSFRSYVYSHFVSADCKRRKLWNSLGDTLNNYRAFGGPKSACDRRAVIVSTASKRTWEELEAALQDEVGAVHVDQIPADITRLGLSREADELALQVRFGNTEDAGALERYRHDPRSGTFLRVTPAKRREPTPDRSDRFPYVLIPRATGKKLEAELYPALQALRDAILDRWMKADLVPTELDTRIWLFEGIDGIQRNVDYLGEDRDTAYLRTDDFTLDPHDVAVVFGVHHSRWGKSIYNNFSVYDSETLSGIVGSNSSEPGFAGGAAPYLADTAWASMAPLFYVWTLRRTEEPGEHTLVVPHELRYEEDYRGRRHLNRAHVVPMRKPMFCGFRMYVNPDTGVGPAWEELLYDRVIKLSPAGC